MNQKKIFFIRKSSCQPCVDISAYLVGLQARMVEMRSTMNVACRASRSYRDTIEASHTNGRATAPPQDGGAGGPGQAGGSMTGDRRLLFVNVASCLHSRHGAPADRLGSNRRALSGHPRLPDCAGRGGRGTIVKKLASPSGLESAKKAALVPGPVLGHLPYLIYVRRPHHTSPCEGRPGWSLLTQPCFADRYGVRVNVRFGRGCNGHAHS